MSPVAGAPPRTAQPPAHQHAPPAGEVLEVWELYLDLLEQAVRRLETDVATGLPPAFPGLALPAGPLPEELAERVRYLLTLSAEVAVRTQGELDRLASQIQHLPRRLSRPDRRYAVNTLDVIG